MGKYVLPNDSGIVNIIAGEYNNVKGSAYTFSEINLFDVRLNEKAEIKISFPEKFNTGILIIEGSVKVNGSEIAKVNNFVLFKNESTDFVLEALEKSTILVLNGKPLNEPIATYGPFLMNTNQEIQQAIIDYNNGDFGYLED